MQQDLRRINKSLKQIKSSVAVHKLI